MSKNVQPSMGCGYVVFVILAAGGLALLGLGVNQLQQRQRLTPDSVVPGVMGIALTAGALGYLRLARRIVRDAQAEQARRDQFPGQPWKWKKEWQGPAIAAKGAAGAAFLWVFAVFWNAISWGALAAILSRGFQKPGEYFILLFPLVGAGLLWAALYQSIRIRKYGRIRFVPSSLPGVIGGYLGGVIEVPVRVVPEADATVSLKCVRRETRGSGKNRRTTDNVLWARDESIGRDQWLTGMAGTRIPVLFYIPAGQPESDESDRNNEIVWRLGASAATAGVDFATEFEVPVFATGETAAPPEGGAPVLEEYKPQPLDGAALAAAGVRRAADTFYFSANHLPGTKFITGSLTLFFVLLLGWFWTKDVPGPLLAVTSFFALVVGIIAAGVWFDRFELRIEGVNVVVSAPRPWGTRITRVPRAEVVRIETNKGMSSGENQYFTLSLVGSGGTVPDSVPSEGEPFHLRKMRYRLAKLRQDGNMTPEKRKELGAEIAADMKNHPKFVVPFARHIPGQGRAEAIAAMLLQEIRRK